MSVSQRNVDMPKRQQVLADFGEFTLRNENLDEVLTEACRLVGDALGTGRAKVLEIQDQGQTLFVRAGVGWEPSVVGQVRLPMGEHSSETFAIQQGRPIFMQDVRNEERFEVPEFMKKAGVVALVNVPIRFPGGKAYGLLQVDATEPRDFGDEDTEFLRTYATILGPIIDRLQKLSALRSTEERFRLVVENARDYAIFTSDTEDRITDWYPGAEAVLGWSAEEAIGQPAALVFTREDRAAEEDAKERETACCEGSAPNVRWHQHKDGSRVFIEGVTTTLHHADGSLRGFLKIGQDVTKRRLAEERQREREKRQALLLELSDTLGPLSEADATMKAASRLLAEHLEASRVLYFQVEGAPDGDRAIVAAQHVREGEPFPERISYVAFHEGAVGRLLKEGGRMVVADSATDARLSAAQRRMWLDVGVGAAAAVPLVKSGRVVAIVGAQQGRPRDWTAADLDVIGEVAERTWAAGERARAEEALRESEDRQQFLLALSDALGPLTAPLDMAEVATASLCERLGADRVYFGEIEGVRLTVMRDHARGVPSIVGERSLEAIGLAFLAAYQAGAVIQVDDVEAEPRLTEAGRADLRGIQVAAFADAVLFEDRRRVSLLAVQSSAPRTWTPWETELIRGVAERLRSAVKRARAEEALRKSEERLRQFGEASQDVLWIRDAKTLQWVYLTQAFEETYGLAREAALAGDNMTAWLDLILPEDQRAVLDNLQEVCAGERVSFEYRIRRSSDDAVRWLRDTDFPMHDEAGQVRWIGGVGRDITDEKAAVTRQEVLVNELQHRARNLLGVVTAVADRTVKQGGSVLAFEERLQALSRAQGLLSKGGSDTVEVGALMRAELAAHSDSASKRVMVSGPKVLLNARQVQNFALAVHELTTNAVKYGALKGQAGQLAATWEIVLDKRDRRRLALSWVESGVAIEPGKITRRGYGTELIQEALAYALEAEVDYELGADGVRCRIEMPIT